MKVSIFITCLVDQFFPQVGLSLVQVLRRLGCEVDFPAEQTSPAANPHSTAVTEAKRGAYAERLINVFDDSEYIVAPSGWCTSIVKVF